MRALLAALRGECRLVLVGDPDQLPSVGPGNLLSDLIRSGVIPMVRLTEIFRQAAESAIVMNAHGVNRGELPDLRNQYRDFFFLRRRDPLRTAETIVELVQDPAAPEHGHPRRPDSGALAHPAAHHRHRLPQPGHPGGGEPRRATGKAERRFGEYIFREGDRVMQVRNNYDIIWQEQGRH